MLWQSRKTRKIVIATTTELGIAKIHHDNGMR